MRQRSQDFRKVQQQLEVSALKFSVLLFLWVSSTRTVGVNPFSICHLSNTSIISEVPSSHSHCWLLEDGIDMDVMVF